MYFNIVTFFTTASFILAAILQDTVYFIPIVILGWLLIVACVVGEEKKNDGKF